MSGLVHKESACNRWRRGQRERGREGGREGEGRQREEEREGGRGRGGEREGGRGGRERVIISHKYFTTHLSLIFKVTFITSYS